MAAVDDLKCYMIAGRTDSAGVAKDDVDQEEERLLASFLLSQGYGPNAVSGAPNPDAFKVRQNTGSDLNVRVGNGSLAKRDLYALRGTVAGQGTYLVRHDNVAGYTVVSVPTPDASQTSRYGVYLFIDDEAYSGTTDRARAGMSCLRGVPGSGNLPAVPSVWSAYVLLWEFSLTGGATAVTNTILDAGIDYRTPAANLVPDDDVGCFKEFAHTSFPANYLECDGSIKNRADYPWLFKKIGTTWNTGGETGTQFRLPDRRGRVGVGRGQGSGLTNRVLAALFGEEAHALSTGELATHNHGISDPGHSHGQNEGFVASGIGAYGAGGGQAYHNTFGAQTGIQTQNAGSGTAHNTCQPSVGVVICIKAY